MFQAILETARRRIPIRLTLVAALALVVGGGSAASPGIAAPAGGVCKITFTRTSDTKTNPALGLSGLIFMGSHNYDPATRSGGSGTTAFELGDTDGFLTLYILMNEWRASGQLEANRSKPVLFHRTDLLLALDATERGLSYQRAVMDRADSQASEINIKTKSLISMKIETLSVISDGLRAVLSGNGSMVEIPPGFMSVRIGIFLDRLTGPDQQIMAQYPDRSAGEKFNVLCDPSAPSALVGQLLCGYSLTNAKRRDDGLCLKGMSMNRSASVPRCRRANAKDECPA